MKFIDSSVFVAAAIEANPHFEASNRFLERQPRREGCTSSHTLVETYSVLTRLPAGHRLTSMQAHAVIANWPLKLKIVALPAEETVRLLREMAEIGIAGGRIYDALHARTAVYAGAAAVVTWNVKHFAGLEQGIEIETP
ncbi:MAG: PIN domain-containing protein [Pseudomonadota bacterium]